VAAAAAAVQSSHLQQEVRLDMGVVRPAGVHWQTDLLGSKGQQQQQQQYACSSSSSMQQYAAAAVRLPLHAHMMPVHAVIADSNSISSWRL
jgi:hypothetical protein